MDRIEVTADSDYHPCLTTSLMTPCGIKPTEGWKVIRNNIIQKEKGERHNITLFYFYDYSFNSFLLFS